MDLLKRHIPTYLYEKKNLIRLVVFTAVFALVFINIYKPFSSENWYHVTDFMFFVFSSLIILTGVLVVVISRVIMFHYGQKHPITYGSYALWIVAEIFFMALFYTIYTLSINEGRDVWETFQGSIINTSLVLLLPYFICTLYFSSQEKERQLQMIGMSGQDSQPKASVISFYDEKRELRLSVMRSNLLYIESADNYVFIWYLNKGVITRFMLRNTLKSIESMLQDTVVLRCHRSYMVNLEHVKVIRREKEGVFLELENKNAPDIPISKTYSERVMQCFINHG